MELYFNIKMPQGHSKEGFNPQSYVAVFTTPSGLLNFSLLSFALFSYLWIHFENV